MNSSDKRNLQRILEFADELNAAIRERGITSEQVLNDQFTQWAITTPLYNIGEFTSHLSRELKDAYPDIPWMKVAGTRHRLVHDYEGTNWLIVSEIIFSSLPSYIEQVRAVYEEHFTSTDHH